MSYVASGSYLCSNIATTKTMHKYIAIRIIFPPTVAIQNARRVKMT